MEVALPVLRWESAMEFFDFFGHVGADLWDVGRATISWVERVVSVVQKVGAELSPGG